MAQNTGWNGLHCFAATGGFGNQTDAQTVAEQMNLALQIKAIALHKSDGRMTADTEMAFLR